MDQRLTEIDFVFAFRYYNHRNYKRASKFLKPFGKKIYRLKNTSADGYLLKLLELKHRYVISIDEDFFLFDQRVFVSLLNHFIQNKIAVAGMRDGGQIAIRNFHPAVINPFFLFLDNQQCAPIIGKTSLNLTAKDVKQATLTAIEGLNTELMDLDSNYEPYYPFFFQLFNAGLPFAYLAPSIWENDPGVEWEKNTFKVATFLEFNGAPFGIHCWFSSGYHSFDNRKKRMKQIYRMAKKNLQGIEFNSKVGKAEEILINCPYD